MARRQLQFPIRKISVIQDGSVMGSKPIRVTVPNSYKKTTLKNDYMKYPANAITVGRVGGNKGGSLSPSYIDSSEGK